LAQPGDNRGIENQIEGVEEPDLPHVELRQFRCKAGYLTVPVIRIKVDFREFGAKFVPVLSDDFQFGRHWKKVAVTMGEDCCQAALEQSFVEFNHLSQRFSEPAR